MRALRVAIAVLVLGSLVSTGCKRKLEAKVKGFKPGSSNIVVVHIAAAKGTEIKCGAAGQNCATAWVPKSGEMDLDVYLSEPSKPQKVFIEASLGSKRDEVVVDLASLPPSVAVAYGYGTISCTARDCSGKLTIAPSATLSLKAAPGTIVEIGSDRLTVPASGSIDAPVNVALSPPIDKQPLEKVCIGLVGGATPNAVLGATTLKLTFPDKLEVSTKVELNSVFAQRDLAAALKKIATGPVAFPWEKPGTPSKGKRAAIYVENDQCYDAGQPGATIADLDVIALAEDQTRVGECSYQLSGEKTGKSFGSATGKITLFDSHATAYDRITGKNLGTKLFLAPKDCTKDFKLGTATTKVADQTSYANEDQIAVWAVTLAK